MHFPEAVFQTHKLKHVVGERVSNLYFNGQIIWHLGSKQVITAVHVAHVRTEIRGSLHAVRRVWLNSCALIERLSFSPGVHLAVLLSAGISPLSRVLRRRKRPAASRIRLNSMQKACTSMNRSWTLMILFLMRDWRKTHTRRTRRFFRRHNRHTLHHDYTLSQTPQWSRQSL